MDTKGDKQGWGGGKKIIIKDLVPLSPEKKKSYKGILYNAGNIANIL